MAKKKRGRRPSPGRRERIAEMRRMKQAGMTWDEIGRSFGMTRQAASQAVKRDDARRK